MLGRMHEMSAPAVDATADMSGNLMYKPEYMENWEELLAEARAAIPVKTGKRRNNAKHRWRNRMHQLAEQHKVLKAERIKKHEAQMLDRHKRALARRAQNWVGPILNC